AVARHRLEARAGVVRAQARTGLAPAHRRRGRGPVRRARPDRRLLAAALMTRPLLITVIGKSAKDPSDPPSAEALAAAELVGANIAGAGAILITGGLSGVMEAA